MTGRVSPWAGRRPAPALLRLCEFVARQVARELADQVLGDDAAGGAVAVGERTPGPHATTAPDR
jgi:hypothetical protein